MAQISKKMKSKRDKLVDVKKTDSKKSREEELEEICVIGYQCKLFRDDERARAIDRGEHLIPWMGDTTLMIDRYDGRGHLLSLSEFDSRQWDGHCFDISAEEERIETLCDEERYMALHKDMLAVEQRQEEEIKRLNLAIAASDSSYNEVAFLYDGGKDEYDPMRPTEDEEQFAKTPPKSKSPELEEPFIAPAELNIPIGIQMPGTKKTHKFMEKTAMFIMGQGAQMEIILKTKQANNPQFSFLQFDHYLNPYYKHLLKCIKSGKYRPQPEDDDEDNHKQGGNNRVRRHSMTSSNEEEDDDDDDNDNSGYLHPSLLGHSKPRPTPMQTGTTTIHTSTSMPSASSSSYPPMDFTKPPPIMGYHDPNFIPPAADPSLVGPSGYFDQANVYSIYPPPPPPPPSGVALSLPSVPPPHYTGMDPTFILPNPHQSIQSVAHPAPTGMDSTALPHQETPSVPHPTSAAAGASPLDDIGEPDASQVIPPPPDIQPVIDKLAKFVAKNGSDFEASVLSKSDPRFDFLLPWHKYNAYYVQKKRMYVQEMGGSLEETEEQEKTKKVSVSFSIKPKLSKEERPLERKSALPIESSDSENEEEKPPSRIPPPQHFERTDMFPRDDRPIGDGFKGRDIPQGEVRGGDDHEGQMSWGDYPGQPNFNPAYRGQTFGEGAEQVPFEEPYPETVYREPVMYREPANVGYSEYPDPYTDHDALQMQGVYERGRASEEELQMKQAKLRLEHRLASAAREKMASASKERIQQMERRKKAAVFLSMIKDRPQAGAVAELDSIEPEPNNIPAETVSPPEKQRKVDSRSDRKKHKRHKHRHGSRRSPSPDRKHKRPPRSYQDANRRAPREAESKPRSRSISPGGRSRTAPPPRSYMTGINRSSKGRRRSRSRSTSPIRPLRSTESQPRRSSSLGATSLPTKSRSQSPDSVKQDAAATAITPSVPDTAPPPPRNATPPPTAAMPIMGTPSQENSDSNSAKEHSKETSEENGSATKEADFQDNFRAKIRAMLAATRQMDFNPS